MSDSVMTDGLKNQFAQAFDVLQGSIESFTAEEWVSGGPPHNGPARAVVHALQCAEFYTQRDRAVFDRLGEPIWRMVAADLPSQQAMLDCLETAQSLTAEWIDRLGAAGLSRPTDDSDASALESIVYALRHLQHHTGEVCAYKKQFGHPQDRWT